jgi:hypothetical protein
LRYLQVDPVDRLIRAVALLQAGNADDCAHMAILSLTG